MSENTLNKIIHDRDSVIVEVIRLNIHLDNGFKGQEKVTWILKLKRQYLFSDLDLLILFLASLKNLIFFESERGYRGSITYLCDQISEITHVFC